MSSSKRRKVAPQETPPSAVSAISALAARRRLAASNAVVAANPPSPSPAVEEDTPSSTQTNLFNILRQQADSPKSAKGTPKAPRDVKPRNDVQRVSLAGATAEAASDLSFVSSALDVQPSKLTHYSSFRLTKRNYRQKSSDTTELRLEDSERFIVLGSFGIRLLGGEVTVAGATLRPSHMIYWIHAPICHAVPVLRTAENTHLELHQDSNAYGLRRLDRLSSLFRRIWNETLDDKVKSISEPTFKIICTSEDAPNRGVIQELVSPPEWNKKLASLTLPVSQGGSLNTIICGPKSAGKSTFSRLLTNRLLTKDGSPPSDVVVLDLDPGQPEYAPPGTVSLIHVTAPNLGTPFTHPSLEDSANKVIRCHALASVTPASAPDFYLESVFDLFDTYRRNLGDRPLVVNTPGWILGTGLDLLDKIIRHLCPQEVLYLSEDGPADTVDTLKKATSKSFTTLPSQQSEFTSRTAAHLRAMQAMSYFHTAEAGADETSDSRLSWTSSPLSAMPPWHVRYSGARSGILGIISYDDQSSPMLLAETINGMVMAAVEIEDLEAFRGLKQGQLDADAMDTTSNNETLGPLISRTVEGLPFIQNPADVALDPRHSRTIGLVLVRGVDIAAQSLQIITPIPEQKLETIRSLGRHIVLVHGKFDTPTWAYTEDLYERSSQEGDPERDDVELMDENTSEDDSEAEPERVDEARDVAAIPWVEVLKGNEKRPVGSRVWRVRRDLGRAGD